MPNSANDCDFNRSMQHLVSIRREEDVADEEVPKEDSLHRNRQSADVGSLAQRRFPGKGTNTTNHLCSVSAYFLL
jgi:hypothetical protein